MFVQWFVVVKFWAGRIADWKVGEVESLKETRKKELVKSGMSLGLRKEDDVFVVESPYANPVRGVQYCCSHYSRDFQDGVKTTWDKQKIANLLSSAFAPNISKSKQTKDSEQSTATIDVLVTFDKGGVSAHANHISLYHGAKHFIASLLQSRLGGECPVDLYTLTSVSIFRKYTSFIDGLVTLVITAFSARQKGDHPSPLYFMSGPKDVQTAQFAMTTGHKSQMVWFRYGWIGLSRYLVVNDLKLEKPLKS